jgi:hypothetical protein
VIPALLLANESAHSSTAAICVATITSFIALFIGEFLERYLFFTAVVAPKMPGNPAS